MLRVLLVASMMAVFAGPSPAQSPTSSAVRTLDVGTIVRLTTDTNRVVGQLAAPLNPDSASRVELFPCPRCPLGQYPVNGIRILEVQTGSSRSTHVALGVLIGGGVGAAAGALAGSNAKIFPGANPGSGTGPFAVVYGVLGALVGTAIGAFLPVRYHWVRILPAR